MTGTTKLMTAGGGGVSLTPASSIASDVTVNVPSVNGTAVVTSSAVSAAGQIPFSTDGSTFTPTAKIVSGTSVTASGTSVDFTSIPSWVKRITVMFNGVSTNGTSNILVQLGDSGGIENTGYSSVASRLTAGISTSATITSGFICVQTPQAAQTNSGAFVLTTLGSNAWVLNGTSADSNGATGVAGGTKILSDTLTQVRITTVNGTDTFDAGSINILYE